MGSKRTAEEIRQAHMGNKQSTSGKDALQMLKQKKPATTPLVEETDERKVVKPKTKLTKPESSEEPRPKRKPTPTDEVPKTKPKRKPAPTDGTPTRKPSDEDPKRKPSVSAEMQSESKPKATVEAGNRMVSATTNDQPKPKRKKAVESNETPQPKYAPVPMEEDIQRMAAKKNHKILLIVCIATVLYIAILAVYVATSASKVQKIIKNLTLSDADTGDTDSFDFNFDSAEEDGADETTFEDETVATSASFEIVDDDDTDEYDWGYNDDDYSGASASFDEGFVDTSGHEDQMLRISFDEVSSEATRDYIVNALKDKTESDQLTDSVSRALVQLKSQLSESDQTTAYLMWKISGPGVTIGAYTDTLDIIDVVSEDL